MLTRLRVKGFKSLWDVDVRFGPFTCIAGPNAVGKSNLFDAIQFLSRLASDNFLDAALSIRAAGDHSGNVRDLFHRWREHHKSRIFFSAEMLIPSEGTDALGQKAEASITTVRYDLEIEYSHTGGSTGLGVIRLISEKLVPINKGQAARIIRFDHSSSKWRNKVVVGGGRRASFISTDGEVIKLHQEGSKGRPRSFSIANLPRTVLSTVNATESPTTLLAKKEMESWKLLQLEPAALRLPDPFLTPPGLLANGGHLPATLYALAHKNNLNSKVYEQISGRLSELIDDVQSILIDRDDSRQLFILALNNRDGTRYEARSLSDGTLRFLALATLAEDPSALGVICMEEPENGIHPSRIPAILQLLKAIACDPNSDVGEDNPLRQVVINTHSPSVVQLINDDDLLVAVCEQQVVEGRRFNATVFKWLSETWRARSDESNTQPIAKGKLISYLGQIPVNDVNDQDPTRREKRLIDRTDMREIAQSLQLPIPNLAP
jgi:predicted ATPase